MWRVEWASLIDHFHYSSHRHQLKLRVTILSQNLLVTVSRRQAYPSHWHTQSGCCRDFQRPTWVVSQVDRSLEKNLTQEARNKKNWEINCLCSWVNKTVENNSELDIIYQQPATFPLLPVASPVLQQLDVWELYSLDAWQQSFKYGFTNEVDSC